MKYVPELRTKTAPPGDYRLFQDGRHVDATGRFATWTPIAFSDAGKTLDPFYLQFLRPGTFVVYLRTNPTVPESAPAAPAVPR